MRSPPAPVSPASGTLLLATPVKRPAKRIVAGVSAAGFTDLGAIAVLWAGLGYAAWTDWRRREVDDHVWVIMGALGLLLGAGRIWAGAGAASGGSLWRELGLWVLVASFGLEHFLPWDERLGRWREWLPGIIELGLYLAVGGAVVAVAFADGFVPGVVAALAAYLGILLARVLFELRLLYGGADAKALMVAGVLLPLWSTPWLPLPRSATAILGAYPFALTLLMDGAICAIVIPIGLAVRNLRAGDFEFPRGFTGFVLRVADLPDRFVWVKDPTFDAEADEAETSEDDRKVRERQRDELLARGVEKVWVTPQLPFVILLAAGAVAGVVLGNIVFDLAALV